MGVDLISPIGPKLIKKLNIRNRIRTGWIDLESIGLVFTTEVSELLMKTEFHKTLQLLDTG